MNPTTHHHFLGPDAISLVPIRTSLNPSTGLLIVKMITDTHTEFAFAVHDATHDALGPMGLDKAIYHYHGVSIDINGRTKEEHMAWGPRRPPHGYPKRPTVPLEVTISETERKLRPNVAIVIKVNRQRPIISIDKWMWDLNNGTSRRSQHIEVSEDNMGEVILSGDPLIIPFRFFFLRDPDHRTPREIDMVIDKECL
ncbi:hypothetical protein N7491_007376 [Penicillium cf. griseofulvum]|uniref:Uncharacterized protein n=1 Tax=Penicillium cf. griseofulvum TaxID=2972120 RepID=A0A9W9IXV6_9EURO|nr:hypothetical protein N7472_009595 [Penicillium cf. griseofulvum]KAJ5430360.1 hypothetical protein N7491_007376 [Penicillium cf. griseofulvum]